MAAKAAAAALDAGQSAAACRGIYEALINQASTDDPTDVMVKYDVERASGISVPTLIYKKMRDALQHEWHAVRIGLPD